MKKRTEDAHIDRLLAQGKLTPEEAGRLRESLQARAGRGTRQSTVVKAGEWRRLALLIAGAILCFVLGAVTFWWLGDAGTMASVNDPRSPASAVADGRLIDLSGLSEERSISMNRSLPLSFAVVGIAILALLAGILVFLYNGLISAREQVNSGWAQVENVYQRRLDLVPLLVDAVQTYTEHERETLNALTRARANALQVTGAIGSAPQTIEQFRAIESAQGEVGSALARLFAIVESYPDLKASRNFLSLQDQIEGTENRVAMERRNYNEFSRRYNTRLQTFPGNIVASMMGFGSKPYFEAETAALRGLQDPFGRRGGS